MPWIERNGGRIFFSDRGAGPPIVLLHSFLFSSEMWAPQVTALASSRRVIAVDFRGHGRSSPIGAPISLSDLVDDVVAVLDDLAIERCVWAGLSIGGMVSMRAALAVPAKVSALVLADTHAGTEKLTNHLKYRAMGLGCRLLGVGPFLPALSRIMFGATTRTNRPELIEEWRAAWTSMDVPSILRVLGALLRRDSVLHRLEEIGVPALVIVGAEDAALPPHCSEQLASKLADSRLVRIPAAGHITTLEQPTAVSDAMIGFLEQLG